MTKVLKQYSELGVAIEYEVHSHHVEFRVREIMCWTQDGVEYESLGDAGPILPTPDFEKACRYIDGSIKWDGCSHLYLGEGADNPGYIHLCGAHSFNRMRDVLAEMFSIAASELPTFDEGVAGKPLRGANSDAPSSSPIGRL